MNHTVLFNLLAIVLILTSAITASSADASHPPALPEDLVRSGDFSRSAPQDVPTTLVAGGVTDYAMAVPKLFWYTQPSCIPAFASTATAAGYAEMISRIATYGGMTRTLYYQEVNSVCPQQVLDVRSNILADDEYVYWMSNAHQGVVRLSTSANVGDSPGLLSNAVSGYARLAQDDDNIYVLSETGGIWRISKTDGASLAHQASPGTSPHSFQTDGKYLYWITGGNLRRIQMDDPQVTTIASGVTGYYPEGSRGFCVIGPPITCYFTEYVFIGQGTQVVRYDNLTGDTSAPIYTSSDGTASVYSLVSGYFKFGDPSHLFLFESREFNCNPFCNYQDVLIRTGRSGGTPQALHTATSSLPDSRVADYLKTDGTFLFWEELGVLKRLPNDAAALPQINMDVTGLEITQGIQDIFNSVRLIENRRTFVRLYVDSDGAPVPGVTAYLYRVSATGGVIDGPLVPVNPVGQQITVQSISNRTKLNDSFLFELPWTWTTGELRLRAVLNPNRVPLEPNYEDNVLVEGPFTFQASPRLQVQFVSFGYQLNNQVYYPRLIQDVFQAYSWIRRVYPLASMPGSSSDPTPGFRPNLWIVADDGLGSRVNQTAPECLNMHPDDRSLCASAYTNSLLNAMRVENGVPANIFMYGMISDAAGFFPRGQAWSGSKVSSGPAGVACCGSGGWDFDGSYADWYAGHEIGHTLNRGHPAVNADDPSTKDVSEGCGHSPDDPNYPYSLAKISDGYAEGFDVGDPGLNPKLQVNVYPALFWYDVMSYCPNQWISDYTYNAMYDYMIAHPSSSAAAVSPTSGRTSGDFLGVFGDIAPEAETATIHRLRRLSSIASMPVLDPGDYSIRLLDGSGASLADYPFTPEAVYNTDQAMLSFGQVVTFAAGTAQVQIVRLSDGRALTSHSLSPNSPTISDVALQGAPDPVTGTVSLVWSASDADGDGLVFDILYSRDGGATFQPLQANVSGSSAQIGTAQLGGSTTAVLRVVASDGINTAQGDTAPFTVTNKPPQPRILLPADGTQIHYGQLLNFRGEALDLQDGSISGANLVWSSQRGQLGTGPLLSISDLPVGVNTITLNATNSLGLSGRATITVVVDDDLDLPGPALSAGPAPVGWHVGAGTTQLQTAGVSIGNAGSGNLAWVASEDAPWLTLSAISGTAPYTLTLTADPSGLAGGSALSTTLWITSPASSSHTTQSVAIVIGLSVGDVWREDGGLSLYPIYLPLVIRQAQ